MKYQIKYSEEVLNAIQNNQPVVALESTIISHGMPYPDNLEVLENVKVLYVKMVQFLQL
jgi:pseudouridine-5'-phosphate glycosidase